MKNAVNEKYFTCYGSTNGICHHEPEREVKLPDIPSLRCELPYQFQKFHCEGGRSRGDVLTVQLRDGDAKVCPHLQKASASLGRPGLASDHELCG